MSHTSEQKRNLAIEFGCLRRGLFGVKQDRT
jgi:hypothetical protein